MSSEVYDSIIAYLENISLVDEVELFINGDLIDRGQDGYRMITNPLDNAPNVDKFNKEVTKNMKKVMK